MLNPARLRHRVKIEKPVEVQDENTGAITTTWEFVSNVWASIEPLSVREMIAADVEKSKVSGRIVIRYRDDIDYTCRIVHAYKDIIYNIVGILPDKESGLEYLTLMVSNGLRENH